jgi:DNA-binding MarR family transcriptional regulator
MMGDQVQKSRPAIRRVWGRRFLASTTIVPPDVAKHLNTDAMAVLAVIRNEAQTTGRCSLPVAQIAERANIGRAKVRAAIRRAESLGVISVEQTSGGKRTIVNRGVSSRC